MSKERIALLEKSQKALKIQSEFLLSIFHSLNIQLPTIKALKSGAIPQLPTPFDGSKARGRTFLNSVSYYLLLQSHLFPNDIA